MSTEERIQKRIEQLKEMRDKLTVQIAQCNAAIGELGALLEEEKVDG
jgi:prefoldin subunit 5